MTEAERKYVQQLERKVNALERRLGNLEDLMATNSHKLDAVGHFLNEEVASPRPDQIKVPVSRENR